MTAAREAQEGLPRASGAARIFRYNWPTYALTWTGAALAMIAAPRFDVPLRALLVGGAVFAVLWSAGSLVVSHYVYDRSMLSGGGWVRALLPPRLVAWASVDAGLDAEVRVDRLPGRCVARLDVYDGRAVRAPSVRRARATTPRAYAATPCPATALALADGSCDALLVIFTAHELRVLDDREQFFREVRRVLAAGGRMLLVEHLRDLPNFAAYGPGCWHFLPRVEWLRLARVTGFRVAQEIRVTPWVMALSLEKPA